MTDTKKKHLEMKANTQFGQHAKVSREDVGGELAQLSNQMLSELGDSLGAKVPGYEYQGSLTIHIYKSPMLNEIIYINQAVGMDKVPEIIASKAFENLRHYVMGLFGRKAGTRRSGF